MSLAPATREALRARHHQANLASSTFDFAREGSLATFWRQATPGTTYWRGFIPMLHLPGQCRAMDDKSLEQAEDGELTLVGHEGTAIWQFLGDDGRSRIATQLQRQGVRTLMEVDDNYLRYAPPLYGKNGAWSKTVAESKANGTGYSVEQHRLLVPLMDGIICATENLAEDYAEKNDNVYVARNSILLDDWEDFERTEDDDILRIGYYGSPSHMRDYPLVKKAIKWAQRQPDVEIAMLGFTPPGYSGKTYAWQDNLYEARKFLGHIDIGIAPLTRNKWSDGKSDVKALEYTMAGVMPLLQDAPPYSPWSDIGWPFMPSTADEWVDIMKDAVQNRDKVKGFAAKAKEYVLARRTIESEIDNWREAVLDG